MITKHGRDVEGVPDFLRMEIVLVANICIVQARIEEMFCWQLRLIEFLHRVHILIWIDALAEDQAQFLFGHVGEMFPEILEVFNPCLEEVVAEGLQTGPEKHQ